MASIWLTLHTAIFHLFSLLFCCSVYLWHISSSALVSSTGVHLQFGAIMNTARNILVHVFQCTNVCTPIGFIPRSRIAGLHMKTEKAMGSHALLHCFISCNWTVYQSGHTHASSTCSAWESMGSFKFVTQKSQKRRKRRRKRKRGWRRGGEAYSSNSIKCKNGLSSLLRSLEYVSEVTHALAFLEGYEGKARTQFPATGT